MATISREQALCICFLYEYNDQNVEKAEKELEDMSGKFDVCYLTDPTIPVLVVKQRIYAAPFTFKQYLSTKNKKRLLSQQIETNKQVIQFINQVYVPERVMDQSVYSLSFVSMHDIFANVRQHSYGFDNKTLNGFSSFCGKNKATFLEQKEIRKKRKDIQSSSTQRYRELYVMKPQYYGKFNPIYALVDLDT
ncbi:hypothetical protein BC941DRAFT_361089 [Chlamydoabsidia padenii]|nr:hypothetical protein BC941DRAFT_361089 [Chlamydoabsidia padenii]